MTALPPHALARRSSRPVLVVFFGVLIAVLTACGVNVSRAATADSVHLVAFAGAKAVHQPATDAWSGATGHETGDHWLSSYGASGDQSRAARDGLPADVVHLSLETDMTRLVNDGVVAADWAAGPTRGIVTRSVVVLVVRPGNPKHITGWADLARDDVSIITPNPGSSGAARWNILAAFGGFQQDAPNFNVGYDSTHSDDESAQEYLAQVLDNVVALPGSGRDATTAFLSGSADVLISQEQEAVFARQHDAALDYIVPPTTLLVENPAAVTIGSGASAAQYLDFLHSADGQSIAAAAGFRPGAGSGGEASGLGGGTSDKSSAGTNGNGGRSTVPHAVAGANDPSDPFPQVQHLLTVSQDFGGWENANEEFFNEAGLVPRIQQQLGRS